MQYGRVPHEIMTQVDEINGEGVRKYSNLEMIIKTEIEYHGKVETEGSMGWVLE